MNFIENRRRGGNALLAMMFVVLTAATAASEFVAPLPHPRVYKIQGYLDRAPRETTVIDRVQIAATGEPTRWLLVTVYRNPVELLLDRSLSRGVMSPYWIKGKSEDVGRLFSAPEGTEVKGTFVLYANGSPWLLIAQLDLPA